MKATHIPIRTCVGCRKQRPKDEMIRFTVHGVDSDGHQGEGRGMYLCPDAACIEKVYIRMDIKKRLGPAAYARILQGLGAVTARENCLDGSSPGSVICDKCHGGGVLG